MKRGEHDVVREILHVLGSTQVYTTKHCAGAFRKVDL